MYAGGGTNDCGEKRNVLIVSILLLIGSNLTLRSNMQWPVKVLCVCEQTVLLHVAGRPKPVMEGRLFVMPNLNTPRAWRVNSPGSKFGVALTVKLRSIYSPLSIFV